MLIWLKYLNGPLRQRYRLDPSVKSKPVVGVDDLLLMLTHHWAYDISTFPVERHRIQFGLILLMLSYTGCRPAELVDATKTSAASSDSTDCDGDLFDAAKTSGTGSDNIACDDTLSGDRAMKGVAGVLGRCKALCYEDISLMVVRDPEGGERDVLAMEVTMAHHKGADRRPKP
jgi:hypothetical protein